MNTATVVRWTYGSIVNDFGSESWPLAHDDERVVVQIRCTAQEAELLADRCFSLGASAVGEAADHEREAPRLIDGPGAGIGDPSQTMENDGIAQFVVLTADLPSQRLAEAMVELPGAEIVKVTDNWSQRWRADDVAVVISDRLILRPPWVSAAGGHSPTGRLASEAMNRPPSEAGPVIDLVIDPGAAFGSGSHPTTQGCLAELQRCLAELEVLLEQSAAPVEVLDVGCGSGVLGIAAVLLGAHSAVGIDIDPAAVAATTANAAANGVADQITASTLPLREVKGTFDLVVANLLAPVFDDLGAEIAQRVKPGGYLVAAGVLAEQTDRVVGNAPNCEVIRTEALGDWIIITLRRR